MATEKDLPHRRWSELRDLWIEHVPPDFTQSDIDSLALVKESERNLGDKISIGLVSGLREQALLDAIFLRNKSLYCFECGAQSNQAGFPTWSSMIMYDACFFAAKAFCYLMGVRDLSRDAKYYTDLFFQEFRKGDLIFDGHVIYIMKERLTHDMLWTIFHRIVRTLVLDIDDYQDRILELRGFKFSETSHERNRVLYKSYSWSRENRINDSDLINDELYPENTEFISGNKEIAEYFHDYYFLAVATNNLLSVLMRDLGKFAPALVTEVQVRPDPRMLKSFAVV